MPGLRRAARDRDDRASRPGPGEVLIRTAACAICHSDIFYIDGAWGGDLPAVYGHEAAGVVEAVGSGVTRLKAGDHVVATLIRNCGFCPACAEGAPVFCEEVFPLDRASPLRDAAGKPLVHGLRTGAFAEHMLVDASQAVAIPKDMKLDVASLIACGVLTGLGAVVNTAGVRAGSSVVVIGCGGVGLNAVQGARLAGCAPIIAVDVAPAKLAAAREFGATHAINAREENVEERVKALTGGRKADWVFVTVGVKGATEQARQADEAQRRDRAGRHAAFGRSRDDRSGLARRRRAAHSGVEDGIGAPDRRRAENRRALSRGTPEARRARHRALSAGADQRGPRLLARRRGAEKRHRVPGRRAPP